MRSTAIEGGGVGAGGRHGVRGRGFKDRLYYPSSSFSLTGSPGMGSVPLLGTIRRGSGKS